MRHPAFVSLIAATLVSWGAPAQSQQLLDRYQAVIGGEDRRNSQGVALPEVEYFIRQDRANFHRFGIRHPGDTADRFFSSADARNRLAVLLQNGGVTPAARTLIESSTTEPVVVEVYGVDGMPSAVRVLHEAQGAGSTVAGAGGASIGRADLVQAQRDLQREGFYDGPIDGAFGPMSQAALDAFRASLGAPTGGPLSARDLELLSGNPATPSREVVTPTDSMAEPTGTSGPGNAAGTALASFEGTVVKGEELPAYLGAWIIGKRPGLLNDLGVSQAIRTQPKPDWLPMLEFDPTDAEAMRRSRARVAEAAANAPFPERIVLELRANLMKPEGEALIFAVSPPQRVSLNLELDPTPVPVIRTLDVHSPFRTGTVKLRETAPLPLRLPPEITALAPPRVQVIGAPSLFPTSDVFVRALLDVSEPRVALQADAQRVSVGSAPVVEAEMTLVQATLVRREKTVGNATPGPETVLHTWTRTDETSSTAGDMSELAAIAEQYGLGLADGRLIHGPQHELAGEGIALSETRWNPGQGGRAAGLALRTAAVLDKWGERPLSQELALTLAFDALLPLEREAILPVGFTREARSSAVNELQWRVALRDAIPGIAQAVQARAPKTPLPMRGALQALIGEYDFERGGFEVLYGPDPLGWSREISGPMGMKAHVPDATTFLPMEEAAAIGLLDRLGGVDRGASVWVLLDYRIEAPAALAMTFGEVTLAEIESVRIPIVPERIIFSEDAAGEDALLVHEFASPEGAKPESDLPVELYATTGESLWGAMARLDSGREAIEARFGQLRGFQNLTQEEHTRELHAKIARWEAQARDSYWIGVRWELGEYDAGRGGFPITRPPHLVPVAHGMDVTGTEPPPLTAANPDDYAFLPASPQEAETIETHLRSRSLHTLVRVRMVGVSDGEVLISAPEEILVGPHNHTTEIESVALRIEDPDGAKQAPAEVAEPATPSVRQSVPSASGTGVPAPAASATEPAPGAEASDAGPSAAAPKAVDILGLELGIEKAEFLEAAEARLPDGVRFHSEPLGQTTLYQDSVAIADMSTGETMLAVTKATPDGEKVIALMRRIRFEAGQITTDAVQSALVEKYGPPSLDSSDGRIVWGVPPVADDVYQVCGGFRHFRPLLPEPFRMVAEVGSDDLHPFFGPTAWDDFGWPRIPDAPQQQVQDRIVGCGPVVSAMIRDHGANGVDAIVWIHDHAKAVALDARDKSVDQITVDIEL